jgi:hypothetical protein
MGVRHFLAAIAKGNAGVLAEVDPIIKTDLTVV